MSVVSGHALSIPSRLRLLKEGDGNHPPGEIGVDHGGQSRATRGETSIRVLIAAGPALVRASYRALLEHDERIEVVAEAASSQQALALATATTPDVALLNLELPGLDDHQATAAIVSHPALARIPVMLIALNDTDERVLTALRAGATGVLSNDARPAELIRALRLLAEGQALLPAGAVRRLLSELPPSQPPGAGSSGLKELTEREREVLALVGLGLSNPEIAAQLVISPATAKTHVSRAMVKLHARDRAQMVVLAYQSGLVPSLTPAARDGNPPTATA
jgi:DNA-binding NarL/FixJ family response regulator